MCTCARGSWLTLHQGGDEKNNDSGRGAGDDNSLQLAASASGNATGDPKASKLLTLQAAIAAADDEPLRAALQAQASKIKDQGSKAEGDVNLDDA
eukprot:6659039-Pyramimonas_sp.AAC.1